MNTINRKHHSLKTDPIPFGETMQGRKLWEIRLNDRDFCEGDTVTLYETASSFQEMAAGAALEYTGRSWNGVITWILHGPQYGLAEGWCIFGVVPGFADTPEGIEARLQYDLENSCPFCGGSGHKDDCATSALTDIAAERGRQDRKWGGPKHDDQKSPNDFVQHIEDYAGWARQMACMGSFEKYRRRMIQVAALAVAAVEAADRVMQRTASTETGRGDCCCGETEEAWRLCPEHGPTQPQEQ